MIELKVADVNDLEKSYPNLFKGIGNLKNVWLKLHIGESTPPVAQHPHRVPFHLCKKVEAELKELEQHGIIEKVDGPTPWISPLVACSS